METRNFLSGIYDDFFGIEKLEKENEKLRKELGIENENIPEIEVKKTATPEEIKSYTKEDKDAFMVEMFSKIDTLYISDESKDLLKKIVEYVRKYNEKLENNYIPFNISLISNNKEIVEKIKSILENTYRYFNYINSTLINIKDVSLYNVDKIDDLTKQINDANIVNLTDLKAIETSDAKLKDTIVFNLEEYLNNNKMLMLTSSSKEELNRFYEIKKDFKDKYILVELEEANPDVQDVYNEVLESISNKEIDKVQLLDYISNTFSKNELGYQTYRDNLIKEISFKGEIPKLEQEKSLDEIFSELDSLVGLEKVKKVVRELADLIELKKKADDLKIKDVNLHMCFLGNPGTGKTTVARIIAGILYNLKYIKENKLIEVSSKDLVAEYVGQTAPKTNKVIERALGGVLFIDEAYSLASGNGEDSSFNEEAIATLIQGMENYRDNLVVIFAGYTKEMQDFLNANSGIVSRIGYTLEFDDYTEDELVSIFKGLTDKAGFKVENDAIDKLKEVIREYKDSKNFGNARFIRTVYEKSVIKHASNTKGKTGKKVLKTLTKEDISTDDILKM